MQTATSSKPRVDFDLLPAHEADTFCRVLLAAVSRAFEDPKVAADYERWKKQREERSKK